MQKKLIARTAKLSSESKKSRRFRGIAITYEHIPSDLEERNHGSIYAVINIGCDNDEAQEVAELIIDAFHGEFYQDIIKDPLSSFEAALAKINEELADITHQGKINWLNNINAVLAVLSGTTFHLTQAGKTEAYLYRGEKSSHVSEDLSGDTSNPLRTFINIASGQLSESDKIAIVTPGVFFHISKDELKKYVQEFQPRVAISHIADLIEGTTTETKPNAVLILEAITPEAASNETLDEQPDEVWITQPSKPLESAYETAKPIVKKTGNVLADGLAVSSAFLSGTVSPFVKEKSALAGESFKKWQGKRAKAKRFKENVLVDTHESVISGGEKVSFNDDLSDMPAETSVKAAVATKKPNEIYIKEQQKERLKMVKLERINLSFAHNFIEKIQIAVKRLTRNRSGVLIATVLVVLVLGGGLFATWKSREGAETKKLAEASLTEAQSKYDAGVAQATSGERKNAVATLTDARGVADKIKDDKNVGDSAKELIAKIQTSIDTALNISRLNAPAFADASTIVGTNPIGPVSIGTNLYLINPDNGSIAAISTNNGEVSNVLDSPTIRGKVVAATAVTARRIIVVITEESIYEFDTKELRITRQNFNGTLEKVASVASFGSNVYSLDGETGKIYKRVKVSGGYGSRTEYITDGSTVTGAKSLAIDSNVYVLNNEGAVLKYLAGKAQTFSIEDLPFTIDQPGTIFTDVETEGFYVTEKANNRLIRVDKDGKYVGAFTGDGFAGLTGVYADDTNAAVYAGASGKIYKINL